MEWIAILLSLGISSSSAGGTVRLEVEGELPCSAEQLREAVALRVALSTSSPDLVTVRPVEAGAEVSYRDQVRRVDLGRTTDVAAARRIALSVSDLVRGPVTIGLPPIEEPPPPPVTATIAAPPPPFVSVESPRAPAILIGPFVRAGLGNTFDRPHFSATLDASIGVFEPVRAVVSAGGSFVPNSTQDRFEIHYWAILASAGVALRLPDQAWEARLLGVVETYFVGGAAPIDGEIDALPAIEAAFLYGFALGGGFELQLGLSLTAYLRQKRFTVEGRSILTTERAALSAALGFTWGAIP